MSKVFIIILNWKRKQYTIDCIKYCKELNSSGLQIEIVVVDNNSGDDSVKAFRKLNGIKLIENDKNLGFAEGNNIGIRYALKNKADYVMVLNNDTELDGNLLIELVNTAEANLRGGAFSPKIYFAKGYEYHKDRYKKKDLGKVFWSAGGDIDWNNVYGKNRGVDEVDKGQYENLEEIDFATGACVLYRAKALQAVGPYDDRYFMYYEDVELSTRMKKRRWKNFYVPDAILWHKVAQSSGIGSHLNDYFITRNRLLFGMKYAPLRARFALLREAIKFFIKGRQWQRIAVVDYMASNFWKGSWR